MLWSKHIGYLRHLVHCGDNPIYFTMCIFFYIILQFVSVFLSQKNTRVYFYMYQLITQQNTNKACVGW